MLWRLDVNRDLLLNGSSESLPFAAPCAEEVRIDGQMVPQAMGLEAAMSLAPVDRLGASTGDFVMAAGARQSCDGRAYAAWNRCRSPAQAFVGRRAALVLYALSGIRRPQDRPVRPCKRRQANERERTVARWAHDLAQMRER